MSSLNGSLTPNSQAILALTAAFPDDRDSPSEAEPLSAEEYGLLAGRLQVMEASPADFLGRRAAQLFRDCSDLFSEERLKALSMRASRVEAALRVWSSKGIWVLTRSDKAYPRLLKVHLREDAPPVIWGGGSIDIVRGGGFAVAGKASKDPSGEKQGLKHGELAACSDITVISTGKVGAEAAAMRSALKNRGLACQVPAKALDNYDSNPSWKKLLDSGRLAIVSPYPPETPDEDISEQDIERTAMALGDCALLVNADSEEDSAWLAAEELLGKYEGMRLFYWDSQAPNPALAELIDMDMQPIPEFRGVVDFHNFVQGPPPAPAAPAAHKPGQYEEVPPEPGAQAPGANPPAEITDPVLLLKLDALRREVAELAATEGMTGGAVLKTVISELIAEGRIDPVIGVIIEKVGYSQPR
ncbi:MAG: DNA-processing protein DprA [Mesosutterella sp.]|nr:DNA-processing protein DprA [Mesosutterella sp.]